jgi:hypothetical protein
VAFVLDGRPVVERSGTASEVALSRGSDGPLTRAERLEWVGPSALAILSPGEEEPGTYSLFVTDGEGKPRQVAERVADAAPETGGLLVAVQAPSGGGEVARLLLLLGDGAQPQLFPGELPGRVTGLSVAPDGSRAVLAVMREGAQEVWVYRFSDGALRRLARLREGLEILGSPQMAADAVYFVAGEGNGETRAEAPYSLYEISRRQKGSDGTGGTKEPAPMEGVGEGFAAASVRVSPTGDRLAILGRRGPGSPVELYVLDLSSGDLRAVTSNEDMEIRTEPDDLAWTWDGRAVLLIARGMLTGTEVYDAPAAALRSPFYNLYEVPVDAGGGR